LSRDEREIADEALIEPQDVQQTRGHFIMNELFSCNRRTALRISGGAAAMVGSSALLSTVSAASPSQVDGNKSPVPAAKSQDVESIESIIAAVYAAISGPKGTRDWDRLRSLFHPAARLIPSVVSPQDKEKGMISTRVFTIDEFIKVIEPRVKVEGFFEQEIARRVERFGAVAHVFSTYESRHSLDDPKPFVRGINSIQLAFDGKRWWVVTILWDSERPGQSIPAEYLPKPA
jgi:hypothetical protein